MGKATTVRFTEEIYQRLDQASARTGLPVNSIVIAACLEWMQRHAPESMPEVQVGTWPMPGPMTVSPPRWSTLRRAVKLAVASRDRPGMYPFDRFSDNAKVLLTLAQKEAEKEKVSYIGTEHLLLAAFAGQEFHSARLLAALGVREDPVRETIKNLLARGRPSGTLGLFPTSRVKKVIEIAFEQCGSTSSPCVGTDHILLALVIEDDGIAARVLKDHGATRKRVEAEVRKLAEPET